MFRRKKAIKVSAFIITKNYIMMGIELKLGIKILEKYTKFLV